MLKKLFGLAPQQEADGSFMPSKVALKIATKPTTDYTPVNYTKYQGKRKKILVLFTEQKNLEMQNGKWFSTGNHPVEALVPMLHLKNAGFSFEVYTPNGKPAVLEMWAFPKEDAAVKEIYASLKADLKAPKSLATFIKNPSSVADYAAIFVPGGHGAMLGIPEDTNVDALLRWAHTNHLHTISICHGPGALLATTLNGKDFLYKGYNMCVFPDAVDKQTPMIGYLPGKMKRGLSEPLEQLGAQIQNSKADASVCLDRRLITGASPAASNPLGILAAETLLKEIQ